MKYEFNKILVNISNVELSDAWNITLAVESTCWLRGKIIMNECV